MRTFLGAVVGYLLFGVTAFLMFRLTGHYPHRPHEHASTAFMIISIIIGIIAALIGGYVAVAIAGRQLAASIVALVIALLAVISAAFSGGVGLWSNLAAICLMAPAAKFGGRFVHHPA
jgi:hypothetical protein